MGQCEPIDCRLQIEARIEACEEKLYAEIGKVHEKAQIRYHKYLIGSLIGIAMAWGASSGGSFMAYSKINTTCETLKARKVEVSELKELNKLVSDLNSTAGQLSIIVERQEKTRTEDITDRKEWRNLMDKRVRDLELKR